MSLSKNIALEVKNVSKSFRLPTEQASGIKQAFINRVRGVKGYTEQHVLKDISFTVEKGDFFGIVGRNGSGKSTLLKLISQIYIPDSGEIIVNGKLVPFIELGVGFNPELTGRENIYLNGALLGFSHEEVSSMYNEIVDFAELADFMDQKLKNYSSGMQVRLAFSIAIKAQGDILVLDEVLAVGDESFQRKCFQYFAQLKKEKKTVILVTHDMESVQRFCNKAIMIEKGNIVSYGDSAKVAQKYRELFLEDEDIGAKQKDGSIVNENVSATVKFNSIKNHWIFDVKVSPKKPIHNCILALIVFQQDGKQIWNWASDYPEKTLPGDILEKNLDLEVTLEDIFPSEKFYANLYIKAKDRSKDYAIFESITKFEKKPRPGSHTYDQGWQPAMKLEIKNDR
jgi:ABC-2 type transport system ATP-binding protein